MYNHNHKRSGKTLKIEMLIKKIIVIGAEETFFLL